jgi:hypothetical protein
MHAEYLLLCIMVNWSIMEEIQFQKGIKKALIFIRAGGDKWTRTTDSRIFSPMLYQLSYITVF